MKTMRTKLQAPWQLFECVALDNVADLELFVVREAHAALLLAGDLGDFVLEVAERLHLAVPDHNPGG